MFAMQELGLMNQKWQEYIKKQRLLWLMTYDSSFITMLANLSFSGFIEDKKQDDYVYFTERLRKLVFSISGIDFIMMGRFHFPKSPNLFFDCVSDNNSLLNPFSVDFMDVMLDFKVYEYCGDMMYMRASNFEFLRSHGERYEKMYPGSYYNLPVYMHDYIKRIQN
jgi:hypothetical protein